MIGNPEAGSLAPSQVTRRTGLLLPLLTVPVVGLVVVSTRPHLLPVLLVATLFAGLAGLAARGLISHQRVGVTAGAGFVAGLLLALPVGCISSSAGEETVHCTTFYGLSLPGGENLGAALAGAFLLGAILAGTLAIVGIRRQRSLSEARVRTGHPSA